ncbi:MAG TPA: VWA domain-containing protein [Spirochaetota bacterium]|nr:VWA domain-containing protein [Spirochaetota bacterium]HPJ34406.1 VWA domain-containing protein [Spirochaetota bacterium]
MKRSIILAVLLSLSIAAAGGCASLFKSGDYYGVETQGKNIVFLIDISGSMEGRNEGNVSDKLRAQAMSKAGSTIGNKIGGFGGSLVSSAIQKNTTKLASAKRELEPAIRGLDVSTKFTVITFSDKAASWKDSLQSSETSSQLSSIAFIERLSANGGTSALKGLKKAFSVKGVDTIFFLSDGFPSDASSSKILKEVSKMNKRKSITIHSIGLGDNKDEDFMKELAEQNNGFYKEG